MEERILKISSLLSDNEAIIIKYPVNRLYFSGFNSSAGVLLITSKNAYFLIDFRYYEKAKNTIKHLNVVLAKSYDEEIIRVLTEEKITDLFLETDNINIDEYKSYSEKFSFLKVSDDGKIAKEILKMRSIKDKNEIANIRAAQKLTDDTFNFILNRISSGRTEREIMLEMEFYMRKNGSEGVAFDFIVVSGKNSSLPHGTPTDKKIKKGDLVTMDFGGVVNGYRSDMTRTVAVSSVTDEQRTVYDTVLKAQMEALKVIKSGMKCSDVDKAARDIIANAGFGECFGHSLGHSVGLEIHEAPSCSPKSEELLSSGNIMTVEPGIYIENKFGVRIEDMVLVEPDGCLNLTKSPKEIIIL